MKKELVNENHKRNIKWTQSYCKREFGVDMSQKELIEYVVYMLKKKLYLIEKLFM